MTAWSGPGNGPNGGPGTGPDNGPGKGLDRAGKGTGKDSDDKGTGTVADKRAGPSSGAGADAKHLTQWVAHTLREQIVSGELSPGDKLPSQQALEGRFKVSTVTVRNAVEELEDEGLIAKRQGAHTQVHDREPTHRLVIRLLRPVAPAAEPADPATRPRITEPPVSFAAFERRRGRLRRESAARQVPASRYVASLLGLREGDAVVERAFLLFDGEEPVLTSTSYLPPALAAGATVPEVDVGQLALVGRAVTSVGLGLRTRMPEPREFETLSMVRGTPVQVLTHRLLVDDGAEPGEERGDGRGRPTVRAAVEVVSRGDRVFVDIELDAR